MLSTFRRASQRWLLVALACAMVGCASRTQTLTPALLPTYGAAQVRQAGASGNYETLHSFQNGSDGNIPYAGLAVDPNGNLFGTTMYGGDAGCHENNAGCGTVYELSAQSGYHDERIVHAFTGGRDGEFPYSPVLSANGALYGVTMNGGLGWNVCEGNEEPGCGVVYRITGAGSQYQESVLHRFQGGADGSSPDSDLSADAAGNIYGTIGSSAIDCTTSCGMVFRIDAAGVKRVVAQLPAPGGFATGVTFDARGNLFAGGWDQGRCYTPGIRRRDARIQPLDGCNKQNGGVVFRLTGNRTYHPSVAYTFKNKAVADGPNSQVVITSNGTVYGTTLEGGDMSACAQGCGTVYRLTPTAHGYKEQTLYVFHAGPDDGAFPSEIVIDPTSGAIYGSTQGGGLFNHCDNGCGVVFSLVPNHAGGYTEHILHVFQGTPDGWSAAGNLMLVKGVLYGVTSGGGTGPCPGGCGTVYSIAP